MFPGMFMRKPDKAEALKQLKTHAAMFGAWVVFIRLTPYVLHYFSDNTEEYFSIHQGKKKGVRWEWDECFGRFKEILPQKSGLSQRFALAQVRLAWAMGNLRPVKLVQW
ncbi:hypothetical protein M9H77_20335 [Catharanthus roseus]|uniref:Uncharacterized protein n=1 Tax=Catharanthus roseus TaxID=4058 RepID=A0ACC0AKP9_CATRO|nr:hypothetical protein M9H77_20335 [Catharanthus roseus]